MTNNRRLPTLWALLLAAGCTSPDPEPPPPSPDPAAAQDVIVGMGHGRYIGKGMKVLDPSPALFERTQRALIERLSAEAHGRGLDVGAARTRLAGPDHVLAQAALIDWLVEQTSPGDHATVRMVNGAIRDAHARATGVAVVERVTYYGSTKYIAECQAAGVPIPPPMYRTGPGNWTPRGSLTTNFLGGDAQLWEYRDENGICLALPRYASPTSGAEPFGIICLGAGPPTDGTNKACFWDNPKGVAFPRDVEVPLTSFVGGYDLEANNQGVCSDCHAGANPFVVHPNDPAFATIAYADMPPTNWYEPIVHPNWPQNPGPSNLLAGEPSTKRCDNAGCHNPAPSGRAGQFPILSTELPMYCDTVLELAALQAAPRTMPPGLSDLADYEGHRRKLRDACASAPDAGKVVVTPPLGTGQGYASRPSLQAVAYACAQKVEVNDVALGALVTLTV
ncbi:MAG TPA: hypothetical protein VK427_14150, partial [Kofleriaceae bacterium]|nr:hypothetical protein [Kofleriaceae bacterium]